MSSFWFFPFANAAAKSSRRIDKIAHNYRMVNLPLAIVEADTSAVDGRPTGDTGGIVGDTAPRNGTVLDCNAASRRVVTVDAAASQSDSLEFRTSLECCTPLVVSGSRLFDNRILPSLADERDTASHHQLCVNLEGATAERDGSNWIRDRRRVNRILNRKPSV